MTDTVALHGVGREYGRTWAVRDVGLELSSGVVGLLGPNGAGKTTLLRVLATSLAPTTGRVSIFGWDADVPEQRTEIRRRLRYPPQELGFPRGFTAFAFVDDVAVLKEWTDRAARHAEVRRVLDLVDLGRVSTKRIRALSGGQRRRLALAQALLGQPRWLVLDEPTTGVDPEQRAGLRGVLAEAARTSVIVLSTHQTEDVAALCERVIVLDAGMVRYDGTVRDLVAAAAGRVWVDDDADPRAIASWRIGSGRYRNIADRAPSGAAAVEPTLEDAYLLLRAETAHPTGSGHDRRGADRGARGAIRTALWTLTGYEIRRLLRNPLFLVLVGFYIYEVYDITSRVIVEADELGSIPASLLGGIGMIIFGWLTQSTWRSAESLDVTPTGMPVRTTALCLTAVVPLGCAVLSLVAILLARDPQGPWTYGVFDSADRAAVQISQVVLPALGGPLLGVAIGRWTRQVWVGPAAELLIVGWVLLVEGLAFSYPDSQPVVLIRLSAPFALFTGSDDRGDSVATWRGSPAAFLAWQICLCALAVVAALLYQASPRLRRRLIQVLFVLVPLDGGLLCACCHGRSAARGHRADRFWAVTVQRAGMRGTAVLLRGAGWPAIIGLTICAALVGGAALTFAGRVGTSAPLLDVAVALLAAAGGFALEEPAAAVVDLTPMRSARLTAARATRACSSWRRSSCSSSRLVLLQMEPESRSW